MARSRRARTGLNAQVRVMDEIFRIHRAYEWSVQTAQDVAGISAHADVQLIELVIRERAERLLELPRWFVLGHFRSATRNLPSSPPTPPHDQMRRRRRYPREISHSTAAPCTAIEG